MEIDNSRRALLKAALWGGVLPLLPVGCASLTKVEQSEALIGCSYASKGDFRAVVADKHGMKVRDLPLPSRGHGVAIHPFKTHAVAFARRPGEFMQAFDFMSGEIIALNLASDERLFYGHGVFSLDGEYLYTTEGVRSSSQGIIGVYSVEQGYKKVSEFTGFGLGPHEIIIKTNGDLVVGVGGVHTYGREGLNLDTMNPSLTYLSPNGEILEQVGLSDNRLSIRHLAHDGDETILCGQQYRGEPDNYPSLIAMHKPSEEMLPLLAEPEEWARFNHYIASIAANEDWILATSPPGNCYGIWDKHTRELVELEALPDASGVVMHRNTFYVSSGAALVVENNYPTSSSTHHSDIQWDNHWSAIPSRSLSV